MAYPTFADKLKSFATWPRRTEQSTLESLAEAGFYYEGMYTLFYVTFNRLFIHFTYYFFHTFHYTARSDETSCFPCNIGLRVWLTSDIPFEEHARWAPACVHLNYIKGEAYVRERRKIARRVGSGDIYTIALNEH